MTFDTLQKSRFILKILTTFCILTNEEFSSKLPKIPPICYKLMVHVPLTFTLAILMYLEFISSSDLNQASEVLYVALTETALVAKILCVWYYDALVKSLFNEWQQNEMFKLQTTQECFMWQRTMKVFGLMSFFYMTCSLCAGGFAIAAVLFLNQYQLPFPYWTPFDWKDSSNYWYAYFYELFTMPFTITTNTSLDVLICYMLQHLALQFKLITMRLENLNTKKNQTDADITKKLVTIIKSHQQLKRMCNSCQTIVSYPILVQILISALVLCFTLYRMRNFNVLEDPVNFLSLICYAVVMILEIFLPCFYGNKLHTESAGLINSIYNCKWPEMSAYNRKIILVYMQDLQNPVVIKAGPFFIVDLATFKKTINNAYSFFALLINMDSE